MNFNDVLNNAKKLVMQKVIQADLTGMTPSPKYKFFHL